MSLYVPVGDLKKKVSQLYTFINGKKSNISTVYTFINGEKKYLYSSTKPIEATVYFSTQNGVSDGTNSVFTVYPVSIDDGWTGKSFTVSFPYNSNYYYNSTKFDANTRSLVFIKHDMYCNNVYIRQISIDDFSTLQSIDAETGHVGNIIVGFSGTRYTNDNYSYRNIIYNTETSTFTWIVDYGNDTKKIFIYNAKTKQLLTKTITDTLEYNSVVNAVYYLSEERKLRILLTTAVNKGTYGIQTNMVFECNIETDETITSILTFNNEPANENPYNGTAVYHSLTDINNRYVAFGRQNSRSRGANITTFSWLDFATLEVTDITSAKVQESSSNESINNFFGIYGKHVIYPILENYKLATSYYTRASSYCQIKDNTASAITFSGLSLPSSRFNVISGRTGSVYFQQSSVTYMINLLTGESKNYSWNSSSIVQYPNMDPQCGNKYCIVCWKSSDSSVYYINYYWNDENNQMQCKTSNGYNINGQTNLYAIAIQD